jgi:hypothetical protein
VTKRRWKIRKTTQLRAGTDEALCLTGKDVGTPIIHFQPPTGIAFFGPVISRLPDEPDALRLWDHVVGLASFPASPNSNAVCGNGRSCARSASPRGEVGAQDDWHGGSHRLMK